MILVKMEAVYAKIAEDTTKFNLGDEEVSENGLVWSQIGVLILMP